MPDEDFKFTDEPGTDDATGGNGGSGNGKVIDPSTVNGTGTEPPRIRKRRADAGVPRGPRGTRKTQALTSLDLSGLQGLFIGLHATIAEATKCPELVVRDEEASELRLRIENVARHYSIQTTQKSVDWAVLVGVTAGVYGTRYFSISRRLRAERGPRTGGRRVIPFPPRMAAQQPENAVEIEPAPEDIPPDIPA